MIVATLLMLAQLGAAEAVPPVAVDASVSAAFVDVDDMALEVPAPAPAPEVPAPAPEAVAAPAPEAAAAEPPPPAANAPRNVKITSDRTDYDNKLGVIMCDRNVFVEDVEYQLSADQLWVFLDTNKLARVNRDGKGQAGKDQAGKGNPGADALIRIVALGNVSITNDTRVGSCAKAVFWKASSKIVMYGDAVKGQMATLADRGKNKGDVEGRKIVFWLDSEQVEVEGSTITLDAGGVGGKDGKDGVRKLFGK